MFFLLLLLITLVVFVNIFYTKFGKDIIAPPLVMATMFLGGTFVTTLNVFEWKIDFQLLTYVIVALGIIVFAIPSFYFAKRFETTPLQVTTKRLFRVSRIKMLIVIATIVCIMGLYIFSIYQLMARVNYAGKNFQYFIKNIDKLGQGHTLNPMITTLLKVIDGFAYVCLYMFINNVIIYQSKRKDDFLLVVPAVLFAAKALLSGGRLDIIKLAIASLITMYVLHKRKVGWHVHISHLYLEMVIVGAPIAIVGFYYSVSAAGRTLSRTIFQTISTYFGGPIQHLNQYVMAPTESSGIFAQETLLSLMNTISSITKAFPKTPSVALEYRQLSVTKGNIYTFFRRPLHDFGFLGMLIFTFLVGLLFAYIYYRFIRNSVNSSRNDFITIGYGYIAYWVFLSSFEQYSFSIISVFTFTNLIVMFFCALFMFYVKKINVSEKKVEFFRSPYVVNEKAMYDSATLHQHNPIKLATHFKERWAMILDLLWHDYPKHVAKSSDDLLTTMPDKLIKPQLENVIEKTSVAKQPVVENTVRSQSKPKLSLTSFWRERSGRSVKHSVTSTVKSAEQEKVESPTLQLSRRKSRRGRVTRQ